MTLHPNQLDGVRRNAKKVNEDRRAEQRKAKHLTISKAQANRAWTGCIDCRMTTDDLIAEQRDLRSQFMARDAARRVAVLDARFLNTTADACRAYQEDLATTSAEAAGTGSGA